MKILMIATFFPPDTAIAAVRPYMFAKYLTRAGHDVTVIRSGEINKKIDASGLFDYSFCRVLSYFGETSAAEVYERTGKQPVYASDRKSRYPFVPLFVKKAIEKIKNKLTAGRRWENAFLDANRRIELMKKVIDSLSDEQFDIVWATVGNWENHDAGRYAAEKFGCPWILDMRDPIANKEFQIRKEYMVKARIQNQAILDADTTIAISQGLIIRLNELLPDVHIELLYNGYDEFGNGAEQRDALPGRLSFCYTGSMYGGLRDCGELFRAVSSLAKKGRIDISHVSFEYAGNDYTAFLRQAEKYGIGKATHNNGYLDRSGIANLQSECDAFIVLAWNKKHSQGNLSGKLFEGIRSRRPILSIVMGDLPDSELYLIDKKYNSGFCYEFSRGDASFSALCDWIASAYDRKMNGESVEYNPSPELFTDFRYDTLTAKLERICLDLIEKKN